MAKNEFNEDVILLENGHCYFHAVCDYQHLIFVDLPFGRYLIGTYDENMVFTPEEFVKWFDENYIGRFYNLVRGDVL